MKIMDKSKIRTKYKRIRSQIPPKARTTRSARISSRLEELIKHKAPEKICLYYPSDTEVDISPIFKDLKNFKLYAPYLKPSPNSTWKIAEINNPTVTKKNLMNLQQPKKPSKTFLTLQEAGFTKKDIAVIPGIAFSAKGLRIGFGSGTFDRFLVSCESIKIGVCFKCQMLPEEVANTIETNFYDISMDKVIYG
jgi:5-formyltetrahydrofolate cyclo-ligase